MKKSFLEILPVFLLVLAIGFSPSFSAGKIESGKDLEIRVEDILLVIFGLVWLFGFLISGKRSIEKPPLFFPILAWVGVGFFSVLINWILGNISYSQGFFFFFKEVEIFFLYFYVYYHLENFSQIKFIIKTWIFIVLINIGWIIYELVTGLTLTYHYGPTPFIEPNGPLPAGGFFLMIFVFLFNVFLFYNLSQKCSKFKKVILGIMIASPVLGLLSSGSRASFYGLILALFLTLFLYFLKKGIRKLFLILFLASVLIAITFLFLSTKVPRLDRLVNMKLILFEFTTKEHARGSIWELQISEISKHPLTLFFGLGKSFLLGGQQSHNQFLKNLGETGIVGSLMFFFLIYSILKKSLKGLLSEKNTLTMSLCAGLFVATMSMLLISIVGEAFMVVKPNEAYWFFAALTMVSFNFNKEKLKNYEPPRI